MTADVDGGRICVVLPSGLDSLSCDEPAPGMGLPTTIASSIGTVYTLVKNAPLVPGTYQLLVEGTDHTPLDSSDPFTVSPCDGCDPNPDQVIVEAFKYGAWEDAIGMGAFCAVQPLLQRVAGKAIGMRGLTMELSGKLVGKVTVTSPRFVLTVSGSVTLFSVTVQDPLSAGINTALDILKQVSCGAAQMYRDMAADPPDPNFLEVALPQPSDIEPLSPSSLDEVVRSVDRQRAFVEATRVAYERYQGASAAADPAAQVAQLTAAGDNASALSLELGHSAHALRVWADDAAADPELGGVVLPSPVKPGLLALYQRVRDSGFTQDEIDQFHTLGYTNADIQVIRSHAGVELNQVPVDTTYPDALRAIAAGLEASAPSVAAFASQMYASAARISAKTPPNTTTTSSTTTTAPTTSTSTTTTSTSSTTTTTTTPAGGGGSSSELVVNGGFSAGNQSFRSSYVYRSIDLGPAGTYMVGANPHDYHGLFVSMGDHTTGTGLMMIVNGATGSNVPVWTETVPVIPHATYRFSAWVASVFPTSPAVLQFSVDNTPLGLPFSAPGSVGAWTQFSAEWTAGSQQSVTITVLDSNTEGGGNDFALDDLSFRAVGPPPNTPPTANADAYATDEDVALTVPAPGVLANDTDAQGVSLAAGLVSAPQHGTITLRADGSFTYTPAPDFHGLDAFTYHASDRAATSNVATATITVNSVNDPPSCTTVKADVDTLWPPDHRLRPVTLSGGSDVDGDAVTISVVGVTQDEPVNGLGDGDTAPDAVRSAAANQVSLRVERSGRGDGRVYVVAYQASDGNAGTCSGRVKVTVPHDLGPKGAAVDSGQTASSFGG